MSLEQFKTQVLLLHSQQSILDKLCSGFGDRYSVHCATSGTEALHTLGETPIHVIVSAQNLPGMSGLEALREAKKRSPDTIGILLAGTDSGDGLEALVGDKEVFQIVRGEVTADVLRNLIDTATRRVRLLTIAESANDTAANMDEPAGEHIVMETSENGSMIISDGSGTMPALKPEKVRIAPHSGARNVDVLVLTKDEEFLVTIKDSSRGLHNVHHAVTPGQADEIVRRHKVGILVTDAAMVGSNIEVLTQRLRTTVPRLVAIVAGRRDDGELLMDLINRGQVYRFLLKPVSPGRARLAIEASVKHHLDAADSAFTGKPRTAASPVVKPAPAPAAAPIRKAAPPQRSPKTRAAPAVSAPPPQKPAPRPAARPAPVRAPAREIPSPVAQGLDDAFAEKDSFTETVAGMAVSVGRSISGASESIGSGARLIATTSGKLAAIARKPAFLAAVGLAVVGLGATWIFLGSDTPESARPAASDEAAPLTATPADASETTVDLRESAAESAAGFTEEPTVTAPLFDDLLDRARSARDAGDIFAPAGSNAMEFYIAARTAAPDNGEVVAELNALTAEVFGLAESALLENRTTDASRALRTIGLADPENPRLRFMVIQLEQQQLRGFLDDARAAIRDARFEDAGRLLSQAETVAGANTGELDALSEELASARSERKVDDVLALANQRLEEDRLTAPSNDNARYYYELALNNDPDNTAGRQGLSVVASKLVLQAREAIDEGNFARADSLLADARAVDPASSEVTSTADALAGARANLAAAEQAEAERQAAAQRQAEAEQQAAAKRQAEAEQQAAAQRQAEADRRAEATRKAEAERVAAEAEAAAVRERELAAETAAQGKSAAAVAEPVAEAVDTAETRADAGDTGLQNGNPPGAATIVPAAADSTVAATAAGTSDPVNENEESASSSPDAGAARDGDASGGSDIVAVSSLKRTNYVAPRYPRAAQRRDISGWVDMTFTVTTAGEVANIQITGAEPETMFNDEAVTAVEQWRFDPVVENGVKVEKRVAVRMSFNLQ